MTPKQTIETQLDCRATASLQFSVVEDLSKPDKPLASILTETEEKDESATKDSNNQNGD